MNSRDDIFSEIRRLERLSENVTAAEVKPRASDTDRLIENVLAKLAPDVQRQWLGNAAAVLEGLLAKAQDQTVSDEQLIEATERIALSMPDLFDQLDWRALGSALEQAAGTAVVNGALAREQEFEAGR